MPAIPTFKLLFLSTLFIVSFVSDILLNDLSRNPIAKYHTNSIIKSLHNYFKDKSIVESGVYAGTTVVVAYLCLMITSYSVGNTSIPSQDAVYSNLNSSILSKIITEIGLAFLIGYTADIIIMKMSIFGTTLDNYYSTAGAGFWGALAFVFAILTTYIVLLVLRKMLC